MIEPLLPQLGTKPLVDNRCIISGILHRYREGLRWRAVLAKYGRRVTLFNRSSRWSEKGIQLLLLAALAAREGPLGVAMVDSATVRAPLGGRRKNGAAKPSGRSRGRPTTKIPALADRSGRLYPLLLTAGQIRDIHGGRALLACMAPLSRLAVDRL